MKCNAQRDGFTLVEILVAVAVLILILVMVGQMMTNATAITQMSTKHSDADAQAMAVFDRMALDFNGMPKRSDLWCDFENDKMYFYSQASGFFLSSAPAQQSPLALIGYRVVNNQLQRFSQGASWSGVGDPAVAYSGMAVNLGTLPANAYEVIGEQVYRMDVELLKTGTTGFPHTTVSDVSAVVVTIAVLDSQSQKLVPSMTNAAAALTAGSGTDATISGTWNNAITTGSSGITQKAAASQIRIYQRSFNLN